MLKRILCCLALFCTLAGQAQTDSCTLEFSLLTCAPGTDLYSLFGHTAIRVQDKKRGMDIVYNYGTFDDRDPLFYIHFTRGIMVYSVSAETFEDFMSEYQDEHRGVIAQYLNLSCAQKNDLYEALRQNTTEEKRYYNYQFYQDNCTTRAGKMIAGHSGQPLRWGNVISNPAPSYRQLIHSYLDRQNQWWPGFGIDMLLGGNLDQKPDNQQTLYFLPDFLMKGLDGAQVAGHPLVLSKQTILDFSDSKTASAWFTPTVVFTLILLISIFLSVSRNRTAQRALLIFDSSFFILLGLLGCLMLYVWIGRVDTVCRNNLNIAWAIPTHLAAVFFIRKNPAWLKYYFGITGLLAVILLAGFVWWPQQMNHAVVPLLLIIILRSFRHYATGNHGKNDRPSRSAASL